MIKIARQREFKNNKGYQYFSRCLTKSLGSVVGPCLSTGIPFWSMMNLVKFHLMKLPRVPPCFSWKGCLVVRLPNVLYTTENSLLHWRGKNTFIQNDIVIIGFTCKLPLHQLFLLGDTILTSGGINLGA